MNAVSRPKSPSLVGCPAAQPQRSLLLVLASGCAQTVAPHDARSPSRRPRPLKPSSMVCSARAKGAGANQRARPEGTARARGCDRAHPRTAAKRVGTLGGDSRPEGRPGLRRSRPEWQCRGRRRHRARSKRERGLWQWARSARWRARADSASRTGATRRAAEHRELRARDWAMLFSPSLISRCLRSRSTSTPPRTATGAAS